MKEICDKCKKTANGYTESLAIKGKISLYCEHCGVKLKKIKSL